MRDTIVVAEFSTALRKISAERWFDNQQDCFFPISCVYLQSIQYLNFLHSIDLDFFFLQEIGSIYLLLQRKYTPKLRNPRLTLLIRDLRKCQAISCQLDFNSCFLLYPDQQFCNLHPHACSICGTNDTSRNVTRCSNPNAHAQFPWAVPYLIILDHC